MNDIIKTFNTILRDQTALIWGVAGTAGMAYALYYFQSRTVTVTNFFGMASNGDYGAYSMPYAVTYAIFMAVIAILFGLSLSLLVWQVSHRASKKKKGIGGLAGGGLFGSFAAGCPICGAYLFSLFGIGGALGILPFRGLELQAISILILGLSIVLAVNRLKPVMASGAVACAIPSERACLPDSKEKPAMSAALTTMLIAVLVLNQILIGSTAKAFGAKNALHSIAAALEPRGASAQTIVMPMLNDDGVTTRLTEMPTISEVPAEPKGGDTVENAKTVMVAKGTPNYAPQGISFDDPVGALDAWGAYESSAIPNDMETRYAELTNTLTCNFCCGSPTRVAINATCGCAHAKAARGFFRYMLKQYGDEYSNDELIGEAYRWQAVWYPAGVVEDYLLATGRWDVIGHNQHGGVGRDGMHGLAGN